jgi:hypothetical protein
MKKNDVILNIIKLAHEFNHNQNESVVVLLAETGYFEFRKVITVNEIKKTLINFPEYVDEWVEYSENKRNSYGWYLRSGDGGEFFVGYIQKDGQIQINKKFIYKIDACAYFIKCEIDTIIKN